MGEKWGDKPEMPKKKTFLKGIFCGRKNFDACNPCAFDGVFNSSSH